MEQLRGEERELGRRRNRPTTSQNGKRGHSLKHRLSHTTETSGRHWCIAHQVGVLTTLQDINGTKNKIGIE